MNILNRALSLAGIKPTVDPHDSRGAALPTGVTRPRHSTAPVTLGIFLARRTRAAEQAFEDRGDSLAHAEARLCRQLLRRELDEFGRAEVLFELRTDPDKTIRNTAQSLWNGWKAAGGRLPTAAPAPAERPSQVAARPTPHPRHSTSLRIRRSPSGRFSVS